VARLHDFVRSPHPVSLDGGVQHYDWGQRGDAAFIPALLGVPAGDSPWAELWIGAHPQKPSQAHLGDDVLGLPELIAAATDVVLGPPETRPFGPRLPFLLKVLAAERPLSIQAHPDKSQAEEGFGREEAAGIPRDADARCYRDDNHKPELIVATGEFFALCGFRALPEALSAFHGQAELRGLLEAAGGSAATLQSLFTTCLTVDRTRLDEALDPLIARLAAEDEARPFSRDTHEHWLLRADRQFRRAGHHDPGVAVMLLLNLVRLAPGQALFLAAGEPHAYLEGVGIELMASSDNVLRGGLTSKHVDVTELGRILTFRGEAARPIDPDRAGVYDTPAQEFQLTAIALEAAESWITPAGRHGADLLLVTEGTVALRARGGERALRRGASVLVPAAVHTYEIAASGTARIYRASLP
jgi:mannose-6-phosphate isomerase class I